MFTSYKASLILTWPILQQTLSSVDSCCFFYSCDEESESGYERGGKQNTFRLGISLKKGKGKVIFTTLWRSYDLEIMNITSG